MIASSTRTQEAGRMMVKPPTVLLNPVVKQEANQTVQWRWRGCSKDDTGAKVLVGLGGLQHLDQHILVHVQTKAEEIPGTNVQEINKTKKYSCEWREIHLAAGCPPGSRGWDLLFQLSPHVHATQKISLSSSRSLGLWEATEGLMEAVERLTAGALGSPTFCSTDRLHLS